MLNGVKNFLQLVNDNWTTIVVIIGLGIGVYKKVKNYLALSNDAKIELAWKSISETMLSMVSDAESNYLAWKEAGAIKRAEVINRIFTGYPILELVTDREEVLNRIDDMIDDALKEMRVIFEKNPYAKDGITEAEDSESGDVNE